MRKLIVLDTNILIRAVLAERVPNLLEKYNIQISGTNTGILLFKKYSLRLEN